MAEKKLFYVFTVFPLPPSCAQCLKKINTIVNINILLDILINGGSQASKVLGKSFRNQVEFELFEINNKNVNGNTRIRK